MSTVLDSLIGSALGTAAAAGGFLVLLRYLGKKFVDAKFARFEAAANERLGVQAEVARRSSDAQAAVYPALAELVYRGKVGAEAIAKAKRNTELLNQDVAQACRDLTEQLYRYRVYLPDDVFELLHEYKHTLQDLLVIGDILTRPVPGNRVAELTEEQKLRIADLSERAGQLYTPIIAELKARLGALAGPLRSPE